MEPKTVLDRGDEVQILDVREDDEFAAGRIEGARHIPLGQLAARVDELDPDRPVVTVCRAGGRASKAEQLLRIRGLTAHTMSGGMTGWVQAGLPVTAAGGGVGSVS